MVYFRVKTSTESTHVKKGGLWIRHWDYCVGTSHHSCQLKLSPEQLKNTQVRIFLGTDQLCSKHTKALRFKPYYLSHDYLVSIVV